MATAPSPVLGQGDDGPAVEKLQRALADAGFSPGAVDGILGTETAAALRSFQRSVGLSADGVYGRSTEDALAARLRVTPSVEAVRRLEGALTASDVAMQVFSHHAEYANRQAALELIERRAPDSDATRHSGAEWVGLVLAALDTDELTRLPEGDRVLHGRLLVDGLARLDPELERLLTEGGVLQDLRDSITPHPDTLFRAPTDGKRPRRPRLDAKLVADAPSSDDLLDRQGFASALATLIDSQRGRVRGRASGPILIHLYGAWGSGKTSLYGMLRRSLETPPSAIARHDREWLCVTFNAWGHQRSAPPWWWLMDRVYREARTARREDGLPSLPWTRRLLLWAWWWQYVLVAAAVLPVMVAGVVMGVVTVEKISGIGAYISAVLGFLAAMGGFVALLRSTKASLLVGSPRAATALLRSGGDPYRRIRTRYRQLVEMVDRNVLVFIDDLDRCQPGYVVELLEGVQTIFNDAPVTYLVAADREWVSESYQQVYAEVAPTMSRPGRSLGYLFLEKTFAVSAPLPRPSAAAQHRYWQSVLSGRDLGTELISDHDREEARSLLAAAPAEQAVAQAAALSPENHSGLAQAVRERAAIKMTEAITAGDQDHVLAPYLPLLEQNPRALKRLGNAYAVATMGRFASLDMSSADDEVDALIRWTILTLRWPRLATRVVEQPGFLAHVRAGNGEALGPELAPLADDVDLRQLLQDTVNGVTPDLEAWVVKEFDPLLATPSRPASSRSTVSAVAGGSPSSLRDG